MVVALNATSILVMDGGPGASNPIAGKLQYRKQTSSTLKVQTSGKVAQFFFVPYNKVHRNH